jgi:hypothetical protein
MAAHTRFLIYGFLHSLLLEFYWLPTYLWILLFWLPTYENFDYLLFIASYRDGSKSRRRRYHAVEVRQETPLRDGKMSYQRTRIDYLFNLRVILLLIINKIYLILKSVNYE